MARRLFSHRRGHAVLIIPAVAASLLGGLTLDRLFVDFDLDRGGRLPDEDVAIFKTVIIAGAAEIVKTLEMWRDIA